MIIKTAQRLQQIKEYYFSVKLKEVRALVKEHNDVINMGIGNPDMMPSDNTIQVLSMSAAQEGNHGYQPHKGTEEFRKAVTAFYKHTYKVNLNHETEVLPLIGSKEGITHISLTFLDPGDEVLVPELGYPAYKAVSDMIGAKVRLYPMDENYYPDWEKMALKDYSKAKLMWANYPHMPSGAKASKRLFQNLVSFAKKNKVLLCHDNPYSLILNEEYPLSLLSVEGAKEVSIELNSLSKSHNMAGWRVGWVSGSKQYIDSILKVKSNIDSGQFKPVIDAATKAMGVSDEWHQQRNKIYAKRRELTYQFLDKLECSYQRNLPGMFLWAKVSESINSVERLVDYLLHQHHIFIAPGFIFGKKGDRYIRVSLCVSDEIIKRAIKRLESFDMKGI